MSLRTFVAGLLAMAPEVAATMVIIQRLVQVEAGPDRRAGW